MKKNLFMVAAVALMAMVSCNKEEINGLQNGQVSDITFTAESDATRTSLGEADAEGVKAVNWVSGDQITVNGVLFSTEDEGSRAVFSTTSAFDEAEVYNAVYPAAAGKSLSAVTIPASQKGTFAEAAISVAQSNTQSLHFKNVASILKFRVPAAAKEVTIESTSNLAGTFEVTFNEAGEPVIGSVTSGSKKITLTGTFAAGTDYYVAVLPGSHKKFAVRVDGLLLKTPSPVVSMARSKISNLGTFVMPSKSIWYIKGNFNGWGTTSQMYEYDTFYHLHKVELMKSGGGFKFFRTKQSGESDDVWIGGAATINTNDWAYKWNDANDVKISGGSATTLYDVYFSKDGNRFYVTLAGSEVPVKSYVLLDYSSSSWTTHKLYAWNAEGNVCGAWSGWVMPKVTINGTSYKYVGFPSYMSSVNIIFNNGSSKTGDIENVTISSNVAYKLSGTTATKVTAPAF